MGFPRQEYWNGLPFPPQGELPDSGMEPKLNCRQILCWRRLLRVSWAARKSNQSILKEINPEYSLEGLMLKLKLKLQYFDQLT